MGPADPDRPEHTERPAPTPRQANQVSLLTVSTEEHALTGICYRTPELQEVILEMLDVELCQVVNTHELYRIRELHLKIPSVKKGDFQGMINVETMRLATGKVQPEGLQGLDGLKTMHLLIETEHELTTKSFTGLESVEQLKLENRTYTPPQTAGVAKSKAPESLHNATANAGRRDHEPVQELGQPRDAGPDTGIWR